MKEIILILFLASSFMHASKNANSEKRSRDTSYYWFDTAGNYLRQNITGDEVALTGYTTGTANPKTLREKGFNPSDCSGWPPVPNDFNFPAVILYSHP
jgi:hypothetical protein